MSAAEAIRRVRIAAPSSEAGVTILTRAYAGLIRTRAEAMVFGDRGETDFEIPRRFWWAKGYAAIEQNWDTGDFATAAIPGGADRVQAFGVRFHRAGLEKMIPGAFNETPTPVTNDSPKESGGRPMSALWPEWVAELVAHIHETGFPAGEGHQGAEELITRIGDGLALRGLEGPSRSTVQETVKAVLRRVRNAGN